MMIYNINNWLIILVTVTYFHNYYLIDDITQND